MGVIVLFHYCTRHTVFIEYSRYFSVGSIPSSVFLNDCWECWGIWHFYPKAKSTTGHLYIQKKFGYVEYNWFNKNKMLCQHLKIVNFVMYYVVITFKGIIYVCCQRKDKSQQTRFISSATASFMFHNSRPFSNMR